MSTNPRRKRLVEKGGVEMFEVRIVQWFDTEGQAWTSVETSTTEGPGPVPLHEAFGAMEMAKLVLLEEAAGE